MPRVVAFVQEVDGKVLFQRPSEATRRVLPVASSGNRSDISGAAVLYLLPEGGVLLREKRLPRASRARVQSIMNLQLASETPFTVDEVYSDSLVVDEDDATREIVVIQALVPRSIVDGIAKDLHQTYGAKLLGVDVADPTSSTGRAGFNVLPRDRRASAGGKGFSVNGVMLLILLGSALFAGWAWRDLQQRRIATAEGLLVGAEAQAAEAMRVNALVNDGVAGIEYVGAELRDPLGFFRAHEAIAALLPDGTWLEEFSYARPVASIAGLSSNSATLVEALESSDLVESAKFSSPVVADPQNDAERFRLQVTLLDPGRGSRAR